MASPLSADQIDAVGVRPTRRRVLAGGLGAAAGIVVGGASVVRAQDATPVASPGASPVASPGATPVSPVAIEPDMQAVLDALAAFENPPVESVTPEVARALPSFANAVRVVEGQRGLAPSTAVAITSMVVPGPTGDIACRAYRPASVDPAEPLPVVAYFHGGGFVIANLDTYEATPKAMAEMANCMVVSAHYRQAPENPFSAAVDDAYAVVQYLATSAGEMGGDPARMAVMGESAGGNLATVCCLKARDEGGTMPLHQVLVYPVTTFAPEGEQTASIGLHANARPLNAAMLDWFKSYYLPNAADAENAYASPILAADLTGLPPASIVLAEIDPLYSQGRAYADALTAAGIQADVLEYTGVTHEFFGMGTVVAKAMEAETAVAEALTTAFGG